MRWRPLSGFWLLFSLGSSCSCYIACASAVVLDTMSSDGETGSGDSLLRALAVANADDDDDEPGNADPGAPAPPPPGRPRLHWRKTKRLNKERPLRAAKKAVDTIGSNLGRGRREAPEGRRQRRDAVSSASMLEMAFGNDPRDPLPTAPVAAARAGFSKETATRSRKIVLDCLQSSLEDRVASCFARIAGSDEPVGAKFQWDETALRMYLPLRVLNRLFPFKFEANDVEEEEEEEAAEAAEASAAPGRGSGSRPSYTVQIMQSQGCVRLGKGHAGLLFCPPKVVHSTSASDLSLPIQLYLPVEQLQALPLDRDVLVIMNGDSFKPNKLIIQHIGEQLGHPVHDGLCFGRRLYYYIYIYIYIYIRCPVFARCSH